MKNFLRFVIISIILSGNLLQAQSPSSISYQAVARDGGNLLTNANIVVRLSIQEGVNAVYVEEHNVSTNDYGLFTLAIGDGTPSSGTFDAISWEANDHFLKIEIDNGGGFYKHGNHPISKRPLQPLCREDRSCRHGS